MVADGDQQRGSDTGAHACHIPGNRLGSVGGKRFQGGVQLGDLGGPGLVAASSAPRPGWLR